MPIPPARGRSRRRLLLRPRSRPWVSRRPRPWQQVVLVVFTFSTLALALALALFALAPSRVRVLPGWVRPYFEVGASQSLFALAVLGLASFMCYWRPRRGQNRPFPIVAGVGLTLVTVMLGMSSYWNCAGQQAQFWAALHWTMALFVGNVEDPFGGSAACPNPMPLALQAARIAALATTFGLAAALVTMLRGQWDRLRAQLTRSVVLVTGIGDDAFQMLERLAVHKPLGTSLVVLERDLAHPNIASARLLGAVVLVGDARDAGQLSAVLRGGRTLRAVYLLSERCSENIEGARRVMELLRSCGGRDGTVPRLVVRIDDPWQAEDWRRRHMVDDPVALSDTVGLFQATARELLAHALHREAERLVLLGSSALTLALLDEIAQHSREEAVFSESCSLDVVVVDPDSAELMADHELHQSRYGNVGVLGAGGARCEGAEASVGLLRGLLDDVERAQILDTREPSSSSLRAAERLAARLPRYEVLVWTDGERGIATEPLMGNLRAYGLTLLSSGEVPEDGWERIARRQHESYVKAYPDVSGTEPGRRPWAELSDFYRQSNLRQIATTMLMARDAGRSWVRPLSPSGGARLLSDDEINALAHREHEAWRRYLTENGWRYAAERDDRKLRHPNLCEWSLLDEQARSKARKGVRDSFALLASLGYHPFPLAAPNMAAGSPADAEEIRRFRRAGRVRAERQVGSWGWTTDSGHEMVGNAGDWLLTDEDGSEWSIRDSDLRRTYRQIDDTTWERSGLVWARAGKPGEVVESQEGPTIVRHSDWVVEDDEGNRWVVPATKFAASYLEDG